MSEILRALAALAEPPSPEAERLAALLELGSALPTEAEHADVFLFQLYPFASVYLGGEGMMGGEARDRIAGFWRALGETPPPEPDHLTTLLAAYAELVRREAEAVEARDDEAASRWRHARGAFLWEHLLSWLPVYLDKLGELDSEFFRSWGETLAEVLLRETSAHPAPEALPLHLRAARALDGLEDAGGEEFLRAITTPVRTGMILVRADLERCAQSLALGLRKGERRYALKSLLGQAPRETLEWLAGEAQRWAAKHRDRDATLASVSSFWQSRAETAATFLRESAAALSPA